jgi:DNA (cytosine-5)-methyltransferase 1
MTSLGGKCVFTSEWERFALTTYKAWYGSHHVYEGDIRSADRPTIPPHDVLCAGFPCQPFSLAGVSKKKSLGRAHGFDDATQGNLFFSILDIVDAVRPPVLFLENVKNLKSHDKGNTWGRILREIEKRNYVVFNQTVDARHWVPQHRERIYIVCFDKKRFGEKGNINFSFPEKKNNRRIPAIVSH